MKAIDDFKLLNSHLVFDAGVGKQIAFERTTELALHKESVSEVLLVDLEVVYPGLSSVAVGNASCKIMLSLEKHAKSESNIAFM